MEEDLMDLGGSVSGLSLNDIYHVGSLWVMCYGYPYPLYHYTPTSPPLCVFGSPPRDRTRIQGSIVYYLSWGPHIYHLLPPLFITFPKLRKDTRTTVHGPL